MRKLQCLLFVLKRSYIYHYIICMTIPLNLLWKCTELRLVFLYHERVKYSDTSLGHKFFYSNMSILLFIKLFIRSHYSITYNTCAFAILNLTSSAILNISMYKKVCCPFLYGKSKCEKKKQQILHGNAHSGVVVYIQDLVFSRVKKQVNSPSNFGN